jgi:hypothetical protein
LDSLTEEQRAKITEDEEAEKAHNQSKVNHFSKLGKAFAVTTSKVLSGGRGGRGGAAGRGPAHK